MPNPTLTGFLKGFGDTTAANRKQSQDEADKAFQRDHDTLATLVEHSNDPEIQNRAMSGLVSMNQGTCQAGGLARFLGARGRTGTSPDVQSLLDFVRSRGASPSGAGAATGGAPPPAPGSAAQPARNRDRARRDGCPAPVALAGVGRYRRRHGPEGHGRPAAGAAEPVRRPQRRGRHGRRPTACAAVRRRAAGVLDRTRRGRRGVPVVVARDDHPRDHGADGQ